MTLPQGCTIVTIVNLQQKSPTRNNILRCVQLMSIVTGGNSNGGKQQTTYLFYRKVGNKNKHHLIITLECCFVVIYNLKAKLCT